MQLSRSIFNRIVQDPPAYATPLILASPPHARPLLLSSPTMGTKMKFSWEPSDSGRIMGPPIMGGLAQKVITSPNKEFSRDLMGNK